MAADFARHLSFHDRATSPRLGALTLNTHTRTQTTRTHSHTHTPAPLPHTLNTLSDRLGGFCRPLLHFSQLPDNENIER